MEFSPFNPIVKLCLQGMEMEANNKPEEASKIFLEGWQEARDDFEKFLTAYYVARQQKTVSETLEWLERALQHALKIDDDTVKSAFPALYSRIAKCYEDLGESEKAKENSELAKFFQDKPFEKGPFYHGTKADLQVGDLLKAGGNSNYKSEFIMNHIYFTALANGAGLAAALAQGEGRERVYIVEPTGKYESDPNLTDKKFPGNPTRSYRSEAPLRIVGEFMDWVKPNPEDLQKFRERLKNNQEKGEIIN